MAYPLTSIIILTKNNVQFTERCVLSIYEHTDKNITPYEIIILDEDSIDGTKEFCELHQENVRYENVPQYNSFASRNNYGVSIANGDYLWFLNNDTELINNNLLNMLRHFAVPEIGVVSNKHLFPNESLNHIGMAIDNDLQPVHIFPHADPKLPYIDHGRYIDLVTHASVIFKRSVFEELQGYDEQYSWGYEDVDIMLRVKQKGYKTYVDSDATLIHFGQSTYGRTDEDDLNRRKFMDKWGDTLEPNIDEIYKEKLHYESKQKSISALPKRSVRKSVKSLKNIIVNGRQKEVNSENTIPESEYYIVKDKNFSAFSNLADQLARANDESVVINHIDEVNNFKKVEKGLAIFTISHFTEQYLDISPPWVRDYRSYDINYVKNDYEQKDYWTKALSLYSRRNVIYLASSNFCADFLLKSGIPHDQVEVLPHGYNPAVELIDFEDVKDDKNEKTTFLLIINTNDESRYGTHRFTEAIVSIAETNPEVISNSKILIKNYGGKPTEPMFLADEYLKLKETGIEIEYISEFLSEEDLMKLYYRSDVFIAPFRGEGFGMKIIDAAAAGIPIVCPNFGGPADYLPDTEHVDVKFKLIPVTEGIDKGPLVQNENYMWADVDPADLANKILFAHENKDSLKEAAFKKREIIREKYSWKQVWSDFKKIDAEKKETYFNNIEMYEGEAAILEEDLKTPSWKKDSFKSTLLINTINTDTHIPELLEHLDQTFDMNEELEGEILIVDDASDAQDLSFMDQFANLPIRYIRYENWGGLGKSKNVGLREAAGELIILIGDDIKPMPGFFKRHRDFFSKHDEEYILQGHVEWDPTIRNDIIAEFATKYSGVQFSYEEFRNYNEVPYLYTPNISFRRSDVVKKGLFFKSIFFEDTYWGNDLTTSGFKIYYSRHICALHKHRMTSSLEWLANKSRNIFGYQGVNTFVYNPASADEAIGDIPMIMSWMSQIYPRLLKDDIKIHSKSFDFLNKDFRQRYESFEKIENANGFNLDFRKHIHEHLTSYVNFLKIYGIAQYLTDDEDIAKTLGMLSYQRYLEEKKDFDEHKGVKESLRWFIKNGRERYPQVFEKIFRLGKFVKGEKYEG